MVAVCDDCGDFTEAEWEAGYRALAAQDTDEDRAVRQAMRDRARQFFTDPKE